jgi:hypothetical protein
MVLFRSTQSAMIDPAEDTRPRDDTTPEGDDSVNVSGRCTEANVTAVRAELRTNCIALHPAVVTALEKRASEDR